MRRIYEDYTKLARAHITSGQVEGFIKLWLRADIHLISFLYRYAFTWWQPHV